MNTYHFKIITKKIVVFILSLTVVYKILIINKDSAKNEFSVTYVSPELVQWSNISDSDRKELFIQFVSTVHIKCPHQERGGYIRDGGWDVCLTPPYNPQDSCVVYSFGIKYDFSFDFFMAYRENCLVRSYDPNMKVSGMESPKVIATNILFYEIGLGERNGKYRTKNWTINTFGTILKANKEDSKEIDMLKMDIEGSEWGALKTMYNEESLSCVKQLAFEIHLFSERYEEHYDVLLQLEKIGFRRYHVHQNLHCEPCLELYYLNTNFLNEAYKQEHCT